MKPIRRTIGQPKGVAVSKRQSHPLNLEPHEDRWPDDQHGGSMPTPPPGVKTFNSSYETATGPIKRLQLWIPLDVSCRLKAYAAQLDMSMSSFVVSLIENYLDQKGVPRS